MYNQDKLDAEKLGVSMSNADVGEWVVILLLCVFLWPAGAIMLFRKLTSRKKLNAAGLGEKVNGTERLANTFTRRGKWAERRYQRRIAEAKANYSPENQIKKMLSNAKLMMIFGGIAGVVFGVGGIVTFLDHAYWGGMSYALKDLYLDGGICIVGLVFAYGGIFQTKKGKRFLKYLETVRGKEQVEVSALAAGVTIPAAKVMDDLNEMLDLELIPVGYLDRENAVLYLTEEGVEAAERALAERQAQERAAKAPVQEEKAQVWKEFEVTKEIREINASINNPVMSEKIERIEDITKKILSYREKNPSLEDDLRTFLNYYLPTTLKILRTYARLEAQEVDGQNITATKERIEGMMDTVVAGFESQLDQLFRDEAIDITSDVQVLEQMLQKDGFAGSDFELKL